MPEAVVPYVGSLFHHVRCLDDIPFERLSPDPGLRTGLGALKFAAARKIPEEVLREILGILHGLGENLPVDQAMHCISTVCRYRPAEVERLMPKGRSRLKEKVMPTMVETWLAEGRAEGETKGRA